MPFMFALSIHYARACLPKINQCLPNFLMKQMRKWFIINIMSTYNKY